MKNSGKNYKNLNCSILADLLETVVKHLRCCEKTLLWKLVCNVICYKLLDERSNVLQLFITDY